MALGCGVFLCLEISGHLGLFQFFSAVTVIPSMSYMAPSLPRVLIKRLSSLNQVLIIKA